MSRTIFNGLAAVLRTFNPRNCTVSVGFIICFVCWRGSSAQPFAPPPRPAVPPFISETYSTDQNGDRVDDRLFARMQQAQGMAGVAVTAQQRAQARAKLEEKVDVELIFRQPITQAQLDAFVASGGEISYIYQAVSYGWNGRIPIAKVATVPALLGNTLLLIEEAKQTRLHMDTATRTGRVRPVWAAGFAGNVAGFDGDPSITIAICDTGVDESHTDLNGRRVYWHDFSTDSAPGPIDLGQHGSHVMGIATGTGAAGGSGTSTLLFTQDGTLSGVASGSFFPSPFELPATSVTVTFTATWNGGGSTTLFCVFHTKGVNGSYTVEGTGITGTSPLTLTRTFTPLTTRTYSPALLSNGTMTDFVVRCQVSDYPGAGDGFNKLRGVAPGCNWAGAKVFTSAGSGLLSWTAAAVDDLVANRVANNIKVMNLSLGADGSPGLSPSTRQKINTAVNNGIVVAVSAGNDGGTQEVDDPGRAAMALTVAAANDVNQLTDYTSKGFSSPGSTAGQEEDYKPDLMAPGGSANYYSAILSVDSNSGDGLAFGDQQANDYYNIQGTSMASPFAAGCAALVIDALQQTGVTWDFNSSQHSRYVKMVLCATASESNTSREGAADNPTLQRASAGPGGFPAGKDQYEGYGMINPDAAVEAVSQTYAQGSTAASTLGPATTDRRVWARTVNLTAGQPFAPSLTVPAGGDCDLYLYSAAPSAFGTPVILASSTLAGNGVNESFTYIPVSSANALLVVKRISGSGTFTLTSPAAPTLSDVEGVNLTYFENQAPAAITSTLTVSDADSANLTGGTVSITSGFANAEDVLAMSPNPQNGISASYGSGVLTLSGSSSVANYQAALRSVTYANTSDSPSLATRTIAFKVNDGIADSNTQTRNITVTAVADTPSVTGASTLEDTQTASGLVISRNAADGAEVTHFKITSISGGLLFQNNGTTAINSGDFITFAQGNAGLKFTPTANSFADGSFVIQASISNADGGLGGSPVTAIIAVTPVNDPPGFIMGADQIVAQNAGPQTIASWAAAISPGAPNESGQTLNFVVSNNHNVLFSVQPAIAPNGTLSFTPTANLRGTATVTVQLHDDGGTANGGQDTNAPQTFTITVGVATDTDGDGLPDDFEIAYGLNPNDPSDAVIDSDGDGFTNLQEFVAGTDPQNSDSALRIAATEEVDADVAVRFTTVAGKQYRLERNTSFPSGSWISVADNIPGTGDIVTATDIGGASGSTRIYRVLALP